jgi:pimeloyl-ACP methyl ester carboxylesterase
MKIISILFLGFFLVWCNNIENTETLWKNSWEVINTRENIWNTNPSTSNKSNVKTIKDVKYDTLSLQTIINTEIVWSNLKLEETLNKNSEYTRYRISYNNWDISISWIMNIPIWNWPYPLLVLNHGYIDTKYYTNGRWLKREQDYFAKNGFAVIHPDYRNHAFSDKISEEHYDFRLWYTSDVIASISAVQNSQIEELKVIDTTNVWMLWHSMWWWITQNIAVVKPDLIDAIILYWPVSNNEYINFEKFQISNPSRSSRIKQVFNDHKNPNENPVFWKGVSSQTFIENIKAPIMIFTWTADKDTPTQWAQNIWANLTENWKKVEIISYKWEWHEFWLKWWDFMNKSRDFFIKNLQEKKIIQKNNNCRLFDDFSQNGNKNRRIINDWVMWWLSQGKYIIEDEKLKLFGNINTNWWGFSSIRTDVDEWLLDDINYIKVIVQGDEREYNITFRDNNIRWIIHQTNIDFKKKWIFEEINIPLSELTATFFWNWVNASEFKKNRVREIGFIISDWVDGPFEIEVESIEFCK